MKKTYSINISGFIFNIDEDAYEKLLNYLNTLKLKFTNAAESEEIIKDIESRIAELFQEKLQKTQVITIDHVNEIIGILGTPEEINDDSQEEKEQKSEDRSNRRLYRDPDNRIIGGVSSGLAAYFNIDRLIMRIIMAATFFFSGPLLYIILWALIPEAKTTAQKLEMSGEKINIENIEKSIKSEFKKVKKSFNEYKDKGYKESKSAADSFVSVVLNLAQFIVRVIMIVIGVSFILAGIVVLMALIGGSFTNSWGPNGFNLRFLSDIFISETNTFMVLISICLIIGIPVISIIIAGIKLLFRIRSKTRILKWTLFGLWIFGLLMLAVASVDEISKFAVSDSETETREIMFPDSVKTIVLKFDQTKVLPDKSSVIDFESFSVSKESDSVSLFGYPDIIVKRTRNENVSVVVKRYAKGSDKMAVKKHIENIEYGYFIKDSVLTFDSFFLITNGKKWRAQSIEIEINIPERLNIEGDEPFNEFINEKFSLHQQSSSIYIH